MISAIARILVLADPSPADVGAGLKPAPTASGKCHPLSEVIRAFKTFSARQINVLRNSPGIPVWQRNYYEHIVRNEQELHALRRYVENNPLQWALDEENPMRNK